MVLLDCELVGDMVQNLIYALNQVKPPFNINRAALFAAAESIKDIKWLNKEINHVNKWVKIFYNIFKNLKLKQI